MEEVSGGGRHRHPSLQGPAHFLITLLLCTCLSAVTLGSLSVSQPSWGRVSLSIKDRDHQEGCRAAGPSSALK